MKGDEIAECCSVPEVTSVQPSLRLKNPLTFRVV